MNFILTEKDCIELETLSSSPNKWDIYADIDLSEGARCMWYYCQNINGVFVSRRINDEDSEEEFWTAYHYTDDMDVDVDDAYIENYGKILMDKDINVLIKKVDEYIEMNLK